MIAAGEDRTALYRFYDADENLLYVGITNEPWRRWRQHVLEKPWYPQVKHWTVTWHDSRVRAEIAEQVAIHAEYPRFNVTGAVRPGLGEVPVKRGIRPKLPSQPLPLAEPELKPAPEPPLVPPPPLAVEPMSEPEPVPEPEAVAPPAPEGRRRPLLIILSCVAWAFLPSMPGMPRNWHSPWMVALVVSTVIPALVIGLICIAPHVHRFGRWLDFNFGPAARESWR